VSKTIADSFCRLVAANSSLEFQHSEHYYWEKTA